MAAVDAGTPHLARLEISTVLPSGRTAAAERSPSGLMPAVPARIEITGWQTTPDTSSVGLAIGVGAGVGSVATNAPDGHVPNQVDVGVRWRSPAVEQRRIDIAAFRRVSGSPDAYTLVNSGADPALYGARMEMQFKSARFGGLTPELGAVGMQLEGGGKVVLRSKRGGPMVYYRASF